MSYLLDKKLKRKRYFNIFLGILFLSVLFYFRVGIFRGLSVGASKIFTPIITIGNNIASNFYRFKIFLASKESLFLENKDLKLKLSENAVKVSNYDVLLNENYKLKEILNRKLEGQNLILASILSKPNQSPYDTLIIDIGSKDGISKNDMVIALGNIPIGYVAETFLNTSKVVLFTSPGEKTDVVVTGQDIFLQTIGRGGGNFEMILPRDFILPLNTKVVLPGIFPYTVGIVESIISDPRDSFIKALLRSPVNIQELKFVQILPQ